MRQVKYFDTYNNGKTKRYRVNSNEQYRCYSRLLRYADKNTVVTHIVYDDGTHEYIDTPEHIKTKQAINKALQDFRALPNCDKYQECVRYGNIISSVDTSTTVGWLTIRTIEIYGRKFVFILISGSVRNCYELQ